MATTRNFSFVGGGSSKFWEITLDQAEVTVRYGKLGAAGQTRVKSLATASEAAAHADKLVAEKLAKGYAESGAATPSTAGAVTAAPASRSRPAAPVDEDTFVIPATWSRHRHPRRGDTRLTARTPDPAHVAGAAGLLDEAAKVIEDALTHPDSDPELVAAARAHQAGGPGDSPLGAAVLAAIVRTRLIWEDTEDLVFFADRWLAVHGVEFAARATVELVSVVRGRPGRIMENDPVPVRRVAPTEQRGPIFVTTLTALAARVRAALAAAPDDVYASTVAALAAYRGDDLYQRVFTSFLAPTETAWVTDDSVALGQAGPADLAPVLLCSVSLTRQVDRIAHLTGADPLMSTPVLTSFASAVGPAAAGTLVTWLDTVWNEDGSHRRLLSVLAHLPSDEAFRALLDRWDRSYVPALVAAAVKRFPRRAIRLIATHPGKGPEVLLGGLVAAHPELAAEVLAVLPAGAAGRDRLRRHLDDIPPPAPPVRNLPAVLVDPPWTRTRPTRKPQVVTGLTCSDPAGVAWLPGERDDCQWVASGDAHTRAYWEKRAAEVRDGYTGYFANKFFAVAPDDLTRPLLATYRPDDLAAFELGPLAARYELDVLPVVVEHARRKPADLARFLAPFTSPEIAGLMADWYARLKSVRSTARAWLVRHPGPAARALVPVAVGKPGTARRHAEQALTALVTAGHRAEVAAAAEAYGPAVVAAVAALTEVDPLDVLPPKIPTVPVWASPGQLPAVQLRDSPEVLPTGVVGHLVTMLAMSRLDEPYAGLEVVRQVCDPASLCSFAWALFKRWHDAGAPPKDDWALHSLGLLGDDAVVPDLHWIIRDWPEQGGHARAVTGCAVLAAIGTDQAARCLYAMKTDKEVADSLRLAAERAFVTVARRRGLGGIEQLLDRMVPDFGLDRTGSLTVDYGPRRFVVRFDERLKPCVLDDAGVRRASLPKPAATDDQARAAAEYQRFAGLKKEVEAVAAEQIRRLEQAMLGQRRWTAGELRRYLVGHPVLRQLVRRLVWVTVGPTGEVTGAFRIAEDDTFADVTDESVSPPDDTPVGVAHPVQLGDDLPRWAEVFADYEILQPFAQLGRGVYGLADDERDATRLTRFDGRSAPTGRLWGLIRREWQRDDDSRDGIDHWIIRHASVCWIAVGLDPGFPPGVDDVPPEQRILTVRIDDAGFRGSDEQPVTFGDLDPLVVSEVLRDLTSATA